MSAAGSKQGGRWVRQKDAEDNARAAVANLLALLDRPLSTERAQDLTDHADYPGLNALTDALSEWGFAAKAVSGEVDELPEIDYPNIAHLEKQGEGHFVVLASVDPAGRRIRWVDPEDGWHETGWDEFDRLWSGVILLVTPPTTTNPAGASFDAARPLNALRWAAPFFITLFLWPWFAQLETHAGRAWFVLKIAGLLFSMAAAFHGKGLLRKLCATGRHINCGSVLASPAAKLFGHVPVADVGVVYFLSGVFVFLTSVVLPAREFHSNLASMALLACAAMPCVLFSLWYQGMKLRQWCLLCLMVLAVLVAEFLLVLQQGLGDTLRRWQGPGVNEFLCLAVAVATWVLLRPLIAARLDLGVIARIERQRQNDSLALEGLLARGTPAPDYRGPDIRQGSADAPHELVMVSHPNCVHCAHVHEEIREQMQGFDDLLTITSRFLMKDKNDLARIRALVPLSLWIQGLEAQALAALPNSFDANSTQTVVLSEAEFEAANAVLEAQTDWALRAGCVGTPTLFLDGHRLPGHINLRNIRIYLRRARREGGHRTDE